MVWLEGRDSIRAIVGTEYEDGGVHRMVFNMMFDGTEDAVPLYAIRANKQPLGILEVIEDAFEYEINDDCTEAAYSWDERKKITGLKVRRRDVKQWLAGIKSAASRATT